MPPKKAAPKKEEKIKKYTNLFPMINLSKSIIITHFRTLWVSLEVFEIKWSFVSFLSLLDLVKGNLPHSLDLLLSCIWVSH